MNIKSISASWAIALCLLGIISMMKQPAVIPNGEDTATSIPKEIAPPIQEESSELKTRADQMSSHSGHNAPAQRYLFAQL